MRSPAERISAADALQHAVFAELRAKVEVEVEVEVPSTVAVFTKPLPEKVAGALLQLATDFDFSTYVYGSLCVRACTKVLHPEKA